MKINIKDITRIVNGQLILGDPKAYALRAEVDTRRLQPDDLFVALKGEKQDGHSYAMAACRGFAAGVMVSDLKWLQSSHGFNASIIQVKDPLQGLQKLGQFLRNGFTGGVVGITGSNGKTTTKQMLAAILRESGPGLATDGNFNSQIGLPLVLSTLGPDDKWMVLELGASEPGHIHKLVDIAKPKIGVITSIGPAHLATFGSVERIAESKWEIMESLPMDGCAVVPWGEPLLEPHIRKYKKKIVFYGEDSACPVRASNIQVGPRVKFNLHIGTQAATVTLPLAGQFNVNNALAASAAAWVLGIEIEMIAKGLESFKPPAMRMQPLVHETGAILLNDAYNANPASMINSVRSFAESFSDKKRIAVLGSMLELGNDSDKHHFHVGSEVGHFPLEKIYLYGDETKSLGEGIMASGMANEKVITVKSHEELIQGLKPQFAGGMAVLFKGSRAMKLENVIHQLMKTGEVQKV